MSGFVYVIGSDDFPFVKIGHAADVQKRLGQLQTGNPYVLKVLATYPGARSLERLIHGMCAFQRTRGEWFDFHGEDPLAAISNVIGLARDLVQEETGVKPTEAVAEPNTLTAFKDLEPKLYRLIKDNNGVTLAYLAAMTGQTEPFVKSCLSRRSLDLNVFRDFDGLWYDLA